MAKKKKDLVQIIKDNPGCVATIDNDSWHIDKNVERPSDFDNWEYEKQEEWHDSNCLASDDDDLVRYGDGGYGSGNCYGGDILQALAQIVGIKIESV
jgi:hypothetical protein